VSFGAPLVLLALVAIPVLAVVYASHQANRAKSQFLANMSHELRTPLNGILGYAQILKRDRLTEEQQAGVDVIKRSGEHLLSLINDILDLAKIEAQKFELSATSFHLPALLQHIADLTRIRAEQTGLSFLYEPLPPLPVSVQGDEKRLQQVLLNLLGNAIKFTEKGSVTLKVGYHGAATGQKKLRFQVEDTGRGIPADKLEEIFLPFQQLHVPGQQVEKSRGNSVRGSLVLLDDLRRYPAAGRDRNSLCLCPFPDRLGIDPIRGSARPRGGRRSAGTDTTSRTGEFSQYLTKCCGVLLAQIDLVDPTVESEGHRLGGLSAVEIVGERHCRLLCHVPGAFLMMVPTVAIGELPDPIRRTHAAGPTATQGTRGAAHHGAVRSAGDAFRDPAPPSVVPREHEHGIRRQVLPF